MRTVEDIAKLYNNLRVKYGERDDRYANNWYAYRGEFNKISYGYSYDLQDVRRSAHDNVQVWNLIMPIVATHTMLMSRLPQMSVPAPVMGDPLAKQFAEKIERALYALWDQSLMIRQHGEAAFNKALYNATVWFVRWDNELDIPVLQVRDPGTCYPLPKRNGRDVAACVFAWQEEPEVLYEDYPEIRSLLGKEAAYSNTPIEVLEYVDEEIYGFIINSKFKAMNPDGLKPHKLEFCPVVIDNNAFVHGDLFPIGAIDQLVALNDDLNKFQTMWRDAIEECMHVPLNIIGEEAGQVVYNRGPGAVNRIDSPNIKVEPQPLPQIPNEAFIHLERTERTMRRIGQLPESASGEMEGSIVTGKAVSRLQGVMTGMAATSLENTGLALKQCNRMLLKMMETYRPKKKFTLHADQAISCLTGPKRPQQFTVEILPEQDIKGYYNNQLFYSPFGSDFATGMTLAMQMVDARLAPRSWVIDQIPGLGDSEGVVRDIEEEDRRRMQLEVDLQVQAQERIMAAQTQQQQQMQAAQGGGGMPPGGGGAPPPEQGMAPPAEGMAPPEQPMEATQIGNTMVLPGGAPQMMGMGEPVTGQEGFPLPYTPLKPFNQALDKLIPSEEDKRAEGQSEALPGREVVKVQDVIAALSEAANRKGQKSLDMLKGQVWLTGEIARRGWTDGQIEFAITVKSDQQIIVNALPQWSGRGLLSFVDVTAKPKDAIPVKGGTSVIPAEAETAGAVA